MLRALRAQQAGCLSRRAFATIPHSRADDIAARVAAGVVQGDRFMLSKAMTFAEVSASSLLSRRPTDVHVAFETEERGGESVYGHVCAQFARVFSRV